MRKIILLLSVLSPLSAQNDYPRHNFTFGGGVGRPRGDLGASNPPALQDAGGITFGYGYRFLRYFQADIGMDILFGAARVREFLITNVGDFRIKDREYFVPMGGRAIAPLFGGRLLFSGGGGGAYMKYSERINQPSTYYRIDCPICTSRSGWGYYAQTNASYFLDRYRHFRVGATARFIRGHTEGESIGPLVGVRTKDHWINIFGEIGFSF